MSTIQPIDQKLPEYCSKRENTIHYFTSDKVFRCCGEKVPNYLFRPSSVQKSEAQIPITVSTTNKSKKAKGNRSVPEMIIISSPSTSPVRVSTQLCSIKVGQYTDRQIVELYRKGSITRTTIEKKIKTASQYGLVPAITIPSSNEIRKPPTPRDSRKLVVFVGSSTEKWATFQNLGVSSKVFDNLEEIIIDIAIFARMLLNSSPNWIDAELLNPDYFDIQQIILATFFSSKEGPHRLEVQKHPITISQFLLDFPGGATTKIFLIVKYWAVNDKRAHIEKQQQVSKAFVKALDVENESDKVKKEEYSVLSIGNERPSSICAIKRTTSMRQTDSSSSPVNKKNRYLSPELPILPLLEDSELSTELDTPPGITSSPPHIEMKSPKEDLNEHETMELDSKIELGNKKRVEQKIGEQSKRYSQGGEISERVTRLRSKK